jgi:hypothetical protein
VHTQFQKLLQIFGSLGINYLDTTQVCHFAATRNVKK